jgi:hypothetical protein
MLGLSSHFRRVNISTCSKEATIGSQFVRLVTVRLAIAGRQPEPWKRNVRSAMARTGSHRGPSAQKPRERSTTPSMNLAT